jgi:ethanolamine utilization protein EutQ (cupin superfamily)
MLVLRLTTEDATTWSKVGDDEVLILTEGSFAVRTEHDEVLTARAGEVIYLPAGSSNSSHADEDAAILYVANPPSVDADHLAAAAAGVDP